MNPQADSESEESIIEKILADGKSQADRARSQAERSAGSEIKKAEKEAEKVRAEILGQARRRAELLRSKEVAAAQIEAKRSVLGAREEAISRVFGRIEGGLGELRKNREAYAPALLNLAVEAVGAVDADRVVLRLSPADREIADPGFLQQVTQRVGALRGETEVGLEEDADLSGGGCVAASMDGRVIFDNTFRRRLERMKPALRAEIAGGIGGSDG
jgi:vacuolar-type H+-ATPase subunit E/Vma4